MGGHMKFGQLMGACMLDHSWNDIAEHEGIGRCPEDTIQAYMADAIAHIGGGMVIGRWGHRHTSFEQIVAPPHRIIWGSK